MVAVRVVLAVLLPRRIEMPARAREVRRRTRPDVVNVDRVRAGGEVLALSHRTA